jgi:hypothetical protein
MRSPPRRHRPGRLRRRPDRRKGGVQLLENLFNGQVNPVFGQ